MIDTGEFDSEVHNTAVHGGFGVFEGEGTEEGEEEHVCEWRSEDDMLRNRDIVGKKQDGEVFGEQEQ